MKHVYSMSALLLGGCLLCGCTTGNERVALGNNSANNSLQLNEYRWQGEAAPPTSTGQSVTSLSRANWQPVQVIVPVDGLAQKPTYGSTRTWANDSARARGQMPTAVSALELEGSKPWAQRGEAVASPLYATWDTFSMIVWDLWATPAWNESTLPPQGVYQRATPETPRLPPADSSEAAR